MPANNEWPSRVNILGVGVSVLSLDTAVEQTISLLSGTGRGYICITGVHGIIEAQDDERFREILNNSFLTTPDGMPTVWLGRLWGHSLMSRVYGPDYMLRICEASVNRKYRHFLYGGKDGVAESLKTVLEARFPGLQIVGTYTPPFRPLTPFEESAFIKHLEETTPDILWVGLSTPKQERFMSANTSRLPVQLTVGVGAAFDLLSGNLMDAPRWMKDNGLQWLFRLMMEPRRLWRRYLVNNPRFLFLVLLQYTGMRPVAIDRTNKTST